MEEQEDEIRKQIDELEGIGDEDIEELDFRTKELNIQKFMDDMRMLGEQVTSRNLVKPTYNYGDLSTTNYLLWLILGELRILNDAMEDE